MAAAIINVKPAPAQFTARLTGNSYCTQAAGPRILCVIRNNTAVTKIL